MSIHVPNNVYLPYAFLMNGFPSPFNSRGRRWRTVEEFLGVNGSDRDTILEGVTLKFRSNIHLLNMLQDTHSTPITGEEPLASILMEVRRNLADKSDNDVSSFKRMMISLTQIVRDNGFTSIIWGGREVSLPDMEEGDYIMELRGEDKEGKLDIFLSSQITDSKIRSIITPYKKEALSNLYILIGSLSRGSVARSITQLSFYHSIRYYSPAELLVDFSTHILSPRVELAGDDDPVHQTPMGSLPEISADDPLVKQLGYSRPRGNKRTILKVYDFNPHYRVVV